MTVSTKIKCTMLAAGAAVALTTLGAGFAKAEDVTLTMAVPDWPPTRIMKKFFDEQYKPKSGNHVVLDVDFIPWPDFYTRVNASLTSGEEKYNFIVSDSQWLGAFVEGGYYRKINDLLDADPDFKKTIMEVHPAVLAAYSTYPYKSTNYYGFPQFPDVLVNFARKDVLCDETEQKNFQAKYNKKLPCTGEEIDAMTWDDFKNVGEFFRRKKGDMLAGKPADDDFYGIAFQAGKGYDFSSMQINGMIWQNGGDIWDETKAPESQAEGVVNSDIAVKSLKQYLEPDRVHAAGGQDRHHGHLQVGRAVPRRQGGHERRLDRSRRRHDRSEDLQGHGQAGGRPGAGHHGRRQDGPLVQYRRPALRADHLDHRHPDQGSGGVREVVALAGDPERVRGRRRPVGHQVGVRGPEIRDLPPVEPGLGRLARLAEGRVARAAVLRAADRAAGPVRPRDHRQAGRQDDLGQHRQVPAGPADASRPDPIT
jgi:hypothetical protein